MIFVEGHGEVKAVGNLVVRLWVHLGLASEIAWKSPLRWPLLHLRRGIDGALALARQERPDLALILRDDEDGCPAESGPATARWVREGNLPFPVSVVMAYREFETWFLPSIPRMAGQPLPGVAGNRPGLSADTSTPAYPENIRGVKEWLSRHYSANRSYKATTDQLPLTQLINLDDLVRAGFVENNQPGSVSSAGSLVRGLQFLSSNLGSAGSVYPK
jgi:hypothetical protein